MMQPTITRLSLTRTLHSLKMGNGFAPPLVKPDVEWVGCRAIVLNPLHVCAVT